jgi:hypothetical protein
MLGERGAIGVRSPTQLTKEGKLGRELKRYAELQGDEAVRVPISRDPVIVA